MNRPIVFLRCLGWESSICPLGPLPPISTPVCARKQTNAGCMDPWIDFLLVSRWSQLMEHSEGGGTGRALCPISALWGCWRLVCLSADGPSSWQWSSLSGLWWCGFLSLPLRPAGGRSASIPDSRRSLLASLHLPQLCKQPLLKLFITQTMLSVFC